MPPISLGTTVAYVDNSGRFSRLNEMANIAREGEPNIVEVSKVVPSLLPNDIDLLTNSRENAIILLGKTGTNIVFGYKYLNIGDKRQQAAWFKWKLNKNLIYHFIIDDEYFMLDQDDFLQKMPLVESSNDISIVQDDVTYLLHLDNSVSVTPGTYDATTDRTTFHATNGSYKVVASPPISGIYSLFLVDIDTNLNRVARYRPIIIPDVQGATPRFLVQGDFSHSNSILHVGYVYDYEIEFPKFYPFKSGGGGNVQTDVNSSLVLHRIKLHFGKVGVYKTLMERVGKPVYEELYESTILDEYDTGDAPYLEEFIKTVPIYERNTNIKLTLKSSHPSPATLHSLSWEGDYSPRFYRRV